MSPLIFFIWGCLVAKTGQLLFIFEQNFFICRKNDGGQDREKKR